MGGEGRHYWLLSAVCLVVGCDPEYCVSWMAKDWSLVYKLAFVTATLVTYQSVTARACGLLGIHGSLHNRYWLHGTLGRENARKDYVSPFNKAATSIPSFFCIFSHAVIALSPIHHVRPF